MAMRLGIVGSGFIVDTLGPRLRAWGFDIAALCGTPRSAEKVAKLAEKLDIAQTFTDFDTFLAKANIDTVYVATPNSLHYQQCEAALLAGKDVICEKPFAVSAKEAHALEQLAKRQGRFLWEALVVLHQPNFRLIKEELLPRIGEVKIALANYSQYSSRYDAFLEGTVMPAFDPAKAGGAIMDIGIYPLGFLLGLFGQPGEARYFANIDRGIDTSGMIMLNYDSHVATAICAKDCGTRGQTFAKPNGVLIEGTRGYITMDTSPNKCGPVTLHEADGNEQVFDQSFDDVWQAEWLDFRRQQESGAFAECYEQLSNSVLICETLNCVRRAAGIVFPSDE